jgi:hypothetical protein
MKQYLEIEKLSLKRGIEPGDDLTELIESIKNDGQEVPILVTPRFEVVDGMRRIKALLALNETQVVAEVVTTIDDILTGLTKSRLHGKGWRKPSSRRCWEINVAATPFSRRRINENRRQLRGKPRHSKMDKRLGSLRTRLSQALGFSSESFYGTSVHLYNLANNPEDYRYELARQMAAQVEAGTVTIYGVRERMERAEIFQGDLASVKDQRQMLRSLIANLSGVVKSAQRMGPLNPHLPRTELEGYRKDLLALRRELYIFVKMFEQETTK